MRTKESKEKRMGTETWDYLYKQEDRISLTFSNAHFKLGRAHLKEVF